MPLNPLFETLKKRAATTATRRRPNVAKRADRVLADLPRWIEKVKALPDIRWEKVAELRESLDAGQYDVDTRFQDMLDHLPDELATLEDSQF